MEKETDDLKKELLIIRLAKMKAPTLPKASTDKIKRLQSDIRQLQQSDDHQYTAAAAATRHSAL